MRFFVNNGAMGLGRVRSRLGEPMVLTPSDGGAVLEDWAQASEWASQAVSIYGANPSNPSFAGIPSLISDYTELAESNEVQALIQAAHMAVQLNASQAADYTWVNMLGSAYGAAHQAWIKATGASPQSQPQPPQPQPPIPGQPVQPQPGSGAPSQEEPKTRTITTMPEWLPIAGVAVAAVAVVALIGK